MTQEEVTSSGTAVKQFSVFLANRVGALSHVVQMLNDNLVEVIGLSVSDSVDATVVRMVVSDPVTAERVFHQQGVAFSESALVVVGLPEGAASLAGCLAALLMAEVNIHYSYPLLPQPMGRSMIAFYLDDADFGVSVLNQQGFGVLCQEDLSR